MKLILLALALVFLSAALYFYLDSKHFLKDAMECDGHISAMKTNISSKHGTDYSPIYSFTDHHQQTHSFRSYASSNPPNFSIGDKVRILYNPLNPSEARVKSFFQLWGFSVIFLSIGLGQLGCACYLLITTTASIQNEDQNA